MLWYLLFALTTAIVSYFDIFLPQLRMFKLVYPEDEMSRHFFLSNLVVFIFAFIFAPFVILMYIIPSWSEIAGKAFYSSLEGK